jgi:hypothetical protein
MDQKLLHLYTMVIYLTLIKKESLLFAGKWMELENINLSETRLTKPKATCFLSHMD